MKGKVVGATVVAAAAVVFGAKPLTDMLTKWESGGTRVLTVYADKLAGGLPTVCNGLTRHVTTTPIVVGEKWSTEECEREEKLAMEIHVQRPLLKCFYDVPPQSVFDAASSHAWNFGVQRTCNSSSMRYWNTGAWDMGCERLYRNAAGKPNWSYAGGKFYRGLQNRRIDEYQLCMRDVK